MFRVGLFGLRMTDMLGASSLDSNHDTHELLGLGD
jgi:hypothetical protein